MENMEQREGVRERHVCVWLCAEESKRQRK